VEICLRNEYLRPENNILSVAVRSNNSVSI